MRSYTHVAFALLLALFIFPQQYVLILITVFFSLFPDIDVATSKVGKHSKGVSFLFEHRTLFHSPLLTILIFFILYYFNHMIAYAALVGILSHLVLDQLNYMAIPWFFPLRWRIKGFCKSGGIIDHLLLLIFIILIVVTLF